MGASKTINWCHLAYSSAIRTSHFAPRSPYLRSPVTCQANARLNTALIQRERSYNPLDGLSLIAAMDSSIRFEALESGSHSASQFTRKDFHTIYHKEAESEGIRSILAVPITVQDEFIGILRLLTEEVRYFTDADINFAMVVAEEGGIAIQKAIDFNRLKKSDGSN